MKNYFFGIIYEIKTVIFSVAILASICFPVNANAFVATPVKFDFDIYSGEINTGIISVSNDGTVNQVLYPSIQEFLPEGEDGGQQIISQNSSNGWIDWIKFNKSPIILEPGKASEFRWSIEVPESAESGGYYAVFIFSGKPDAEQGAGLSGRIGILLLMNVVGAGEERAHIESFGPENGSSTAPRILFEHLDEEFVLRIRNEGLGHIRPRVQIIQRDWFGRTEDMKVYPAEGAILPNSIRRFTARSNQAGSEDSGFINRLIQEWNMGGMGKNSVIARIEYGQEKQILSQAIVYWVVPWRSVVCLFTTLVLLILAISGYNRWTRKMA